MNNNYIKVKIEGKNVSNYLKWLIKSKINLININIIKHNILEIIIEYKNYKKLFNYSKTYKIKIVKKYGKINILAKIKENKIIIFSILISLILIYFLSNIIFSIDIIYNDTKIKDILNKELEKYNIKKYHMKKDYKTLNTIKENILNDNKDILEWIEIEEHGTKYIIRVVERKKNIENNSKKYQSIIAKKNAVITNIKAFSGEKIRNINEYVKKGETIISGTLTKSNNENIYIKAEGIIYGEVWYKINIEYPLYYREEKLTGKTKKTISISFLNKNIFPFHYKQYKHFKSKKDILVKNNIIPFELAQEKLYESTIQENIYTKEEATKKAIDESKKQLKEKNNKIKEIKEVYVLETQNLGSKIKLNIFISAIEDITAIQKIEEYSIESQNTN